MAVSKHLTSKEIRGILEPRPGYEARIVGKEIAWVDHYIQVRGWINIETGEAYEEDFPYADE